MARERLHFNPERRGNIIPPERGRGGIRFPVTTEDRPGTRAPTLPREASQPPIQNQRIKEALEEALGDSGNVFEQPKGTKKNGARVLISRGILAGLALTGIAWGVKHYGFEDNTSSANPQTSSADFPNSFNSETLKPIERFDNNARSGEIKTIKRIPEEETAGLNSFAKIDDHNTVFAIYPIDVSTSNKPDAKIKYTKGNASSGNDQDRINRAEEGYLNIFYFENVPAGSTILAPVDGRLTLFYSYPKKLRDLYPNLIDEVHNISTAAINFQSRDGKKFRLIIGGGRSGGGMNPKPEHFIGLKSLTDAPIIKGEMSPSEVLEITEQRSVPVKKGQPILQLPDKEFNMSFAIRSEDSDPSKEKEGIINGEKMLIVQEYPTNVELFLSEDGAMLQPQLSTSVTN